MNITDFVPAFEHTLAVLGGLLFINQLRTNRWLRRTEENCTNALHAVVEVAAQTTVVEQDLAAFADIAENTENLITQCGGDVRALERVVNGLNADDIADQILRAQRATNRINTLTDEAVKIASEQALGAVRQMVQNMTLGKQTQNEARFERLEKACGPLPPLARGAPVAGGYRSAIEGEGPSHVIHPNSPAGKMLEDARISDAPPLDED